MRVTLDRNCLIDVEEHRLPYVTPVLELMRQGNAGKLSLSVPASTASERPAPGKASITNFGEFKRWVHALGFERVDFLAPILYLDFSFLDYAVLGGGPGQALEERIHDVLAPKLPYQSPPAVVRDKWRNAQCDVQAVWCHAHYGTDALCTRDEELIRRARLLTDLNVRVCRPSDLLA
jgi:hypothetical protein